MILGRNPALWLALVGALLNVAVLVFGVQLTTDQLVAINGLALAVIGIVANSADPSTLPTFALAMKERRKASSIATASSSTGAVVPTSTPGRVIAERRRRR